MASGSPYDTLARGYDELFVRPRDLAENAEIKRRLLRHEATYGRVLDVGCGTGFLLELEDIKTASYLGVDLSLEMLEVARKKFPDHTFERQDMVDLDYPGDSFDSVVALWSLSYAADPIRAAEELTRVLKPGGSLFVIAYARWSSEASPLPYESWPEYQGTARTMFTPTQLPIIFPEIRNARVQGLSARFVPDWFGARFMRLESSVVGNLLPEACTYLTFSGRKRA